MGVQDELVYCGVIEHSHLFRTDNYKPLLFDRMQPAYENVGLNATREIEVAQGDVKDVASQISAALAGNTIRHLIEE